MMIKILSVHKLALATTLPISSGGVRARCAYSGRRGSEQGHSRRRGCRAAVPRRPVEKQGHDHCGLRFVGCRQCSYRQTNADGICAYFNQFIALCLFIMLSYQVVGVLQRRWRDYVASILEEDVNTPSSKVLRTMRLPYSSEVD